MDEDLDADPDQATFQQSPERERSSRARMGGRRPPEVDSRVWMRERGRETKQLSIPLDTLTSSSIVRGRISCLSPRLWIVFVVMRETS